MTDKKRTNDLASMLGTAQRSAEVPRPQVEETAGSASVTPASPVKRVNLTVHPDLHRSLKILAANQGAKVQELVDEAITQYLKQRSL